MFLDVLPPKEIHLDPPPIIETTAKAGEDIATQVSKVAPATFIIAFLVLTAGAIISQLDYSVVWRYFSWTNQTLAMIVLWAASMYLYKAGKNYFVTMIPAVFMSAVSVTYFVMAKECLGLIPYLKNNIMIAYPVGIITALVFLAMFFYFARKENKG